MVEELVQAFNILIGMIIVFVIGVIYCFVKVKIRNDGS